LREIRRNSVGCAEIEERTVSANSEFKLSADILETQLGTATGAKP
jgi:hypothetical protein